MSTNAPHYNENGELDLEALFEWYQQRHKSEKWVRPEKFLYVPVVLGGDQNLYIFMGMTLDGDKCLLWHPHEKQMRSRLIDVATDMIRNSLPNALLMHMDGIRADLLLHKTVKLQNRNAALERLVGYARVIFMAVLAGNLLALSTAGYFCCNSVGTKSANGDAKKDLGEQPWERQPQFKFGNAYQKAETLYVHDRPAEALLEINKALEEHAKEKSPDPPYRLLGLRGLIYDKLGQHHLAIADLEEEGRTMPVKITPEPWRTLQRLYVQTGNTEKARVCRRIVHGIEEEGGRERGVIEADINELLSMKK